MYSFTKKKEVGGGKEEVGEKHCSSMSRSLSLKNFDICERVSERIDYELIAVVTAQVPNIHRFHGVPCLLEV